jgi:MraZ protein
MLFKRLFVGRAHECPLDKVGRILLPADLRRDAGIERDAVVIGQIDKVEIWSAERWQRLSAQGTDQMGAIYAALAESGIHL